MAVILSAPAGPDQLTPSRLLPRASRWIGYDGSTHDLTNIGLGLVMQNGVVGLHNPKYVKFAASNAGSPGRRLRGARALERDVFWPLLFRADDIDDWYDTYRSFFDSFDPLLPGRWEVGNGLDKRTLDLVGDFSDDYAFIHDPFTLGWASIGVKLEAPQPFWKGVPVTVGPLDSGGAQSFVPPTGGPAFYIGAGATFINAKITNPGDEPAYLQWTLTGPLDDISVGVGDQLIQVPFNLPGTGDTLMIDTDPRNQYATVNGVSKNKELGFQVFTPVPARTKDVPLTIGAVGSGKIQARLIPLYRRAF